LQRRRSIERSTIVEYWHIDEDYHTERQKKIMRKLAIEDMFNDISVVSVVVEEPNLVLTQLKN